MWFLALSDSGLKELYRFASLAHRQGSRGHPRLTFADVRAMSNDIAKFAGAILDGPFLRDISAYLDLDPGMPIANRRKLAMADQLGLKLVMISDNAYAAPEDRVTYEMIGRGGKPTPQHLLSAPEMALGCGLSNPTIALRNMEEIAERASKVKLPKAPIIRVDGDLEALARVNIPARFPAGWPAEYEQRLKYELDLIRSKDYESYFLMVADMVQYAKSQMLVGPSRGSAAGSLVCYLTRITEIDPIPVKLIFERFIDVTRKDLPDIDLDFVDVKRHLVLEYLQAKYGKANVAQIGTVSTYQPKSALIVVAKKLGIPPWETNSVKDSIFERSSGDSRANFALLDTLEQTEPGRKLLEKYPAMRLSANIEAHASHSGVHAAGILVCNEPIENYCTVTADGVAQLDKKDAEKLNLLKIDVLGLRTLGVLEDSGVSVDWYNLKFDDPEVFRVLNDHKFAGIFQFEGQALQSVCRQMTVGSLDDIGHITALARPGPMASGGTKDYLLRRAGKQDYRIPPAMEKYVSETFGVVIYQEQVLKVCKELGDMSWPDVTKLRQAMSKSLGKEYFDQFRDKFVAGAKKNGLTEPVAVTIWEQVNTHGSWSFNLAHSYSYAVVSYWTAWLKAHHLLEFAAATLRNNKNDDRTITILREMTQEGISYVPFDPVKSEVNWCVKDGVLYGGFLGFKGIGESKARAFVEERANGGLSEKSLQTLRESELMYEDLFPTKRRWGSFYTNPERHPALLRANTKVVEIKDIAGEGTFVYVGRLRGKDLRDHNEAVRVRRRDGKRFNGPTLFLDLDIEDDSGKILTRIERFEFEALGRKIWEEAKPNTWWLIKGERRLWGRPDGGFKMIYVDRIKQLFEETNENRG
jgi:DNA polymerase III alpha subunit